MSTSFKPLRLTVAAAAIAAALPAFAQQAQQTAAPKPPAVLKADDAHIQKVEVRGSADAYDPRRDDTASKIVVTHEEIVKYGDTNVLDVLKRVPGITVSGANGQGGEIRMRGLGSGYTQILINGERAPAGFTFDSLAPDMIEKIEVLHAASAEYSTQSIAGTINIVLKKSIKTAQHELKLGYGAGPGHFHSPAANLQLSDRVGKLSYSVTGNAFWQRLDREMPTAEEGYDLQGNQVLQRYSAVHAHPGVMNLSLSPRLNWKLDGGDTLTSQTFINAGRFHSKATGSTETLLGDPPSYPGVDTSTTNDYEFLRSDLTWDHKLEAGKLSLKAGAVIGKMANTQYRHGFGNAGVPELTSVIDSHGLDRGLTSTGKYTNPLWEGHALGIGWDAGFNVRHDARLEGNYLQPGVPLPGGDEHYIARVARLATYAQDEWSITKRWSVYLGARWEGIQIRNEGNTFDTSHSRSSVFSPLLQTLWKLPGTKSDQVRFAVTRTYKAPDVQTLIPHRFTSVNNSQVQPDFMGNPNLRPELALGLDASYEHYWGEGALLSVSASSRHIDDYTRNTVVFDGGRWVSRPTNSGTADTHSVEVEAKFPLKSIYAAAPALDLRASVARNWSTVDSIPGPNNRLDQQTPLSATFGADYKIGKLTAGGSFAFKNGGEVRLSANQTAYETVRRDLDLYLLWKFDPKVQLRVAFSNVLGQEYINERGYTSDTGELRSRAIFPGMSNVRATLEMKF